MTPEDKEAIRTIIHDVLGEVDLIALQRCQERLQEALEQNRELEQNFRIYFDLAKARAKQTEQLEHRVSELTAEIALLRSAIENLND